ncbi:hypothetical protein NLG97_g8670 [Lecanicillium saksenae]|uniref:Uncharacterized protein n=1 Tax=Lecanicillium saksenae TaxID=468837 RepID=A0ACC1QK10_9HYPO|nr:hypothetical protein NLG97_g8670 [Lecanicillium saksenae]
MPGFQTFCCVTPFCFVPSCISFIISQSLLSRHRREGGPCAEQPAVAYDLLTLAGEQPRSYGQRGSLDSMGNPPQVGGEAQTRPGCQRLTSAPVSALARSAVFGESQQVTGSRWPQTSWFVSFSSFASQPLRSSSHQPSQYAVGAKLQEELASFLQTSSPGLLLHKPSAGATFAAASGASDITADRRNTTSSSGNRQLCYPTRTISKSHRRSRPFTTREKVRCWAMKNARRVMPRRGSSHSAEYEPFGGPDVTTEMQAGSVIFEDDYDSSQSDDGPPFSWVDYGVFGFLGMAMLWAW